MACFTGRQLSAQASPAATRAADLQVGASFDVTMPDYHGYGATPTWFRGFGFYSTVDFRSHFGVEAEFHQVDAAGADNVAYERTYEIGPRYVRHYGRFAPYAKLMVGRGVFNFPPSPSSKETSPAANLAYNMAAFGVGTDYHLRPWISLRADFELQRWFGFPPQDIDPRAFRIGVAYRFH